MTKKVKITQFKDKWTISFGGRSAKRGTALSVYHLLERRLERKSSLQDGMKTAVLVKYLDGGTNETVDSLDPKQLLWAASCFLEDYLPRAVVRSREKKYNDLSERR